MRFLSVCVALALSPGSATASTWCPVLPIVGKYAPPPPDAQLDLTENSLTVVRRDGERIVCTWQSHGDYDDTDVFVCPWRGFDLLCGPEETCAVELSLGVGRLEDNLSRPDLYKLELDVRRPYNVNFHTFRLCSE